MEPFLINFSQVFNPGETGFLLAKYCLLVHIFSFFCTACWCYTWERWITTQSDKAWINGQHQDWFRDSCWGKSHNYNRNCRIGGKCQGIASDMVFALICLVKIQHQEKFTITDVCGLHGLNWPVCFQNELFKSFRFKVCTDTEYSIVIWHGLSSGDGKLFM